LTYGSTKNDTLGGEKIMDAIVTAGGINLSDDPLYELTGVEKKALIPLAGQPMIGWVVDALAQSGLIEHIAIVGLKPDEVDFGEAPVYFVDSQGEMISNILAGLEKLQEVNPSVKKILLCSSDIPLITSEIVQGFVEECGSLEEADAYYAIVEEKTMEASFPGSKRTFVPFKGGRYSGGDVFLFDVAATKGNRELFRSLTSSRKNYLNQARMLGIGFIIRFLLRMMTVHEAAARVRNTINLEARVVDTRFAELGMDVDKPHQYEVIKAVLEKREAQLS
jgi:GTP:adenosylcobinamide-phosphate guanylyltransferase